MRSQACSLAVWIRASFIWPTAPACYSIPDYAVKARGPVSRCMATRPRRRGVRWGCGRRSSLKSTVCQILTLAPGTSVGYNRLFVAPRTTRTATLPIGYADGYRRSLVGKANVIVRDRMVPVLGAINMDMIVIDITDVPDVSEGDEVILLGSNAAGRVDAATWAELLGTITYEVLCGIGPRVPRIYLGEAD